LDWIQTRYLFVKGSEQYSAGPGASACAGVVAPPATAYKETKPLDPIEQDKAYTPRGVDGPIVIPRSTIAGARQPKSRSIFSTQNKRQKAAGSKYDPIELDADNDDNASVATLEEDLVSITHFKS
jgi:ubiquitin-conjugating enzyme E2 Q